MYQIASTTAKILGLNEELTESIALGHDIGHAPFGHVGERTLNYIMNNCIKVSIPHTTLFNEERGFKHNLQGVRILSDLHSIYPNLKGTNLSNFTLYGILNHSSIRYKPCNMLQGKNCYRKERIPCPHYGILSTCFYDKYYDLLKIKHEDSEAWSFEANVVALSDEIAQRHHDVEDAILMNILDPDDIITKIKECFHVFISKTDKQKLDSFTKSKAFFTTRISQFLVNMYNTELIRNSRKLLLQFAKDVGIKNRTDFTTNYIRYDAKTTTSIISFSDEFNRSDRCFHKFLASTILNSHKAQRMDGKGSFLIQKIFKAYFTNPRQLHDSTIVSIFNAYNNTNKMIDMLKKTDIGDYRNEIGSGVKRSDPLFEKSLMRGICDHIAGMTDNFVIDEYSRLYGGEQV